MMPQDAALLRVRRPKKLVSCNKSCDLGRSAQQLPTQGQRTPLSRTGLAHAIGELEMPNSSAKGDSHAGQ